MGNIIIDSIKYGGFEMSKKEKFISVIICEVGKPAYTKYVKNTLEDMQKIVGGYIETVSIGYKDYIFVVNEEGLLNELKPNRNGIVGDFFVTRSAPPEFASIKVEDEVKLIKWLNKGFEG
jgi:hypothetical protein